MNESQRRIVRENFYVDVDGFFYFLPDNTKGHFSSHHLREIADMLDKVNEPWSKVIDDYFNGEGFKNESNTD